MSKRIIFCADGTWQSSAKNTNAYRIFKALTVSADQMPFYDDGVGADGLPLERLIGGAFGAGIFQKVKDGYTKISQVYEEGDQIFLFGFSRGAYTARSLAGMIAVAGLPTKNFSNALVDTAFQAYRDRGNRAKLLESLANCDLFDAKLTMVGVWETVGALGIPSLAGGVDPLLYGFLDTGLHPDVLNAYQALAVDERRAEFPATLWSSQAPGQTVEQVWFPGTHGDVGGGNTLDDNGTALSDITLAWMMNKAAGFGLQFDPAVAAKYALPLDPKFALDTAHPSWSILWGFPKKRAVAADAVLSNSLVLRCVHEKSYRPDNLHFDAGVLSTKYKVENVVAGAESV